MAWKPWGLGGGGAAVCASPHASPWGMPDSLGGPAAACYRILNGDKGGP